MDISIMLSQMAQFLLVMCLGYILYKINFLDDEFDKKLTKVVLQITMPCVILASVLKEASNRNLVQAGIIFLIAIGMYFVILPIAGLLLAKILGFNVSQQGLMAFMMVYANIGFMGIPLVSALYGEKAVFFTAIFNLVFNLSLFSLGVVLVNFGTDNEVKPNFKMLVKPGIILPLIALVIYCMGLRIPDMIIDTASTIGGITTPAAMLLIGAALAKIDLKSLFSGVRIYIFSIIKQVAVPLLAWLLLKRFISDKDILAITIVMLAMPIANSAVLFATEYKGDEELAAKTVFITTIMSIVTIPLISLICLT